MSIKCNDECGHVMNTVKDLAKKPQYVNGSTAIAVIECGKCETSGYAVIIGCAIIRRPTEDELTELYDL